MEVARDIMEPALVVAPATDLRELARQLLGADAEGACVCGDNGQLLGVITGMDLVFREKRSQQPLGNQILDFVLGFGQQAARDLERAAATNVHELMTTQVVWVEPTTPLDQVATVMADHHVSTIPVCEDGAPVGVITRRAMIAAALRHLLR
jgi:CBS domain-containing protein